MTLSDCEANGDVYELNGPISSTETKLPVVVSTLTVTSHNEILGSQKVADPLGGEESYVKNQRMMGRKNSGVSV